MSLSTGMRAAGGWGGRAGVSFLLAILLLAFGCAGPEPARRPDSGEAPAAIGPEERALLARRVREEFLHAWSGYCRFAWGHDALRPLGRAPHDWYAESLCMTPLDAFDTMILMGLEPEARAAKGLVLARLSFDKDFEVQVFEITIRHLGALLAAYQLDGDRRFLDLAVDLADRLLPAFDSPTGMPYNRVNLRTGRASGPVSNPAEIGTLTLEFGTVSKLTGNPVYYDRVKRAVTALFERRSPLGLVGTEIDVESGAWTNPASHVGGRIDSYYEYLLKAWLFFGDEDFRTMWEASVAALHRHVTDERDGALWYGVVDMNTGELLAPHFGALQAFLPATLALGGDLDRARRLQESCFRMWTLCGIEPEGLDYARMEVLYPAYPLRPENLESAFTLHRLTGDPRYLEMGRVMFESLVERCRTPVAYAHLADVRTGEKADAMESFFLAETLKYAYLLFAPEETLDLRKVVLNTEAHPLRRTWD